MSESTSIEPPAEPAGPGPLASLEAARRWVDQRLWLDPPSELRSLRLLRSVAQLVALTARGFQNDHLLLRASALTYVTALSLIPMLAVVFAFLSLVGGDEAILDFIIQQLTSVAPEVQSTVRGYVQNLNFARFGTIGGALLFGTAIFGLRHLEMTLNEVWGVPSSRSWARRFSDYLAVLVVAPVTTGIALSLATTLQSGWVVSRLLENSFFARIYGLGLQQVPVFVLFLGFTFLFWFFPNTRVRIWAAALGGAVAAVLFLTARTIYVEFQVGAATYQGVFGALSSVPLILAWLYACWAVLLLGAEVAFAAQNLHSARREMRVGEASPARNEAVAVELITAVGRFYVEHEPPPTAETLADRLDEPVRRVRRLLGDLEEADLLRRVQPDEDSDVAFVPGAPLDRLSVGEVLRAVRGETQGDRSNAAADPQVSATLERVEHAWREVADGQTILDLIQAGSSDRMSEPETRSGHQGLERV